MVAANGDIVDLYNAPRNYHGIRIYLNQGDFEFEEAYFYPMYGAYDAKAADFDGDGDLRRVKGIRMWCWGQGMCQQVFRVRPCLIGSFVPVHAFWCSRTIGR